MMKLTILSAAIAGVSAFAPSASVGTSSALRMSDPVTEEPVAIESAASEPMMDDQVKELTTGALSLDGFPVKSFSAPAAVNGWTADPSLPCFGLPGSSAPLGFFDPLGFTKDMDLNGVKRFREAEILHGRVAMMATIGYIIGENTPTIAYGMDTHHTIGNNQIPEVPGIWLFSFFLAINVTEAARANIGWVEPGMGPLFTLRENYYPGDIGFDPLGLKPKDAKDFANMQTKELNNGRLAMFAAAGMCVQEQINGQGILENLGF